MTRVGPKCHTKKILDNVGKHGRDSQARDEHKIRRSAFHVG